LIFAIWITFNLILIVVGLIFIINFFRYFNENYQEKLKQIFGRNEK